ncbi:MAG: GNAT family N-acetyltransferase [Candidatus Zixiibacteriota bacterium]
MDIPTILTSRLVLRAFRLGDVDRLHEILNENGILRHFPNPEPPDRERVEKFIEAQLTHWEEHGYGWWAVERRDQAALIGWVGLQYLPDTDETEVAFLLSGCHWGQGLATEGAQASLAFGFTRFPFDQIVAVAHPQNAASLRVLEKLGMTFTHEAVYFGMPVRRYVIQAGFFHEGVDTPQRPG